MDATVVLLGGGTAKANTEGVSRAVPNLVIWRRLRLVPTFYELRCRRVAWAQRMRETVQEHDAVPTGLVGQFAFETQSAWLSNGARESVGPAVVCGRAVASVL